MSNLPPASPEHAKAFTQVIAIPTLMRWSKTIPSKWARSGLVAVLLTISGFAVWSSITTGRLGQEAIASSVLADHYTAAATAVAAAESLESKYRLAPPSPKLRRSFKTVVAQLTIALDRIHRSGSPADHLLVEDVRTALTPYLESVSKLFDAVDRGDDARVRRIDNEEADPRFETIERAVLQAAADQHEESIRALEKLRTGEAFNANSTLIVFIAGLLLAGLFAQVLWRTRSSSTVNSRMPCTHRCTTSSPGWPTEPCC
jgi:hypothetical protein